MNTTMNGTELDKVLFDAILKALNDKSVRFDTGDMGEVYIHLDGVKETWCINAAHKCEEYEAPTPSEKLKEFLEDKHEGVTGVLLEFFNQKTKQWMPCELAPNLSMHKIYEHDWYFNKEAQVAAFENWGSAWWDDGCDWDFRLGVCEKWPTELGQEVYGQTEGEGASVKGGWYRLRVIEVGPFSERFKSIVYANMTDIED